MFLDLDPNYRGTLMLTFKKHIFFLYALILLTSHGFSSINTSAYTSARFIENKGQWPKNVLFGARLASGMVFIEEDGVRFNQYSAEAIKGLHEHEHHHQKIDHDSLAAHNFKIQFHHSLLPSSFPLYAYHDLVNFFIGADESKWASNAKVYEEVILKEIYKGIDVRFYENQGHFKFDFLVHPNANPKQIQFSCKNISSEIQSNEIVMKSAIGSIFLQNPLSFQIEDGAKKNINNRYAKNENGNYIFSIAQYNNQQELVIDPTVFFASFSGSTADNWGFTATYDDNGNLYNAGNVFGTGYPVTTGAYNTTFTAIVDVSITKYNSTGKGLVYSTYLGGTSIESPHSIVATKNRELVIFGTTSSLDFPTSANAYDKTFNGGTTVTTDNVLTYSNGADIFVTKLNVAGSALVGSTLIGGNKNDGLNDEYIASKLFYNYGDIFRGEVIVDANGNPIIATTTSSSNFPIAGGFQNVFGGGSHDAIVMKFNANLSSLTWSTFIGGVGDDAAYSVQFDSKGDLYLTGGTQSNNFPTTNPVIHSTPQGGIDGFITHISSNASAMLASTYIGTPQYDQCYFVQLDKNDNVFVYGQSLGAYPVSPAGVYSNPNSHQFIHKLNSSLSSTIFSTVFGSGSANTDLVPSAFLVNNCEDIYISAWGGKINSTYSPNNPPGSTSGMPLTADAYQKTTDGSDFYLAVFSQDAGSLKYGTYFGGPSSLEHVDGGTSRFDKKGNVYQAVCGGCGGNSDFPTTPGAWSTTNRSFNCNLAVIKFDVSKLTANINGNVDSVACVNEPIVFNNSSHGGTSYEWNFGDGSGSTEFTPTHTYSDTGYYQIRLVATDPSGCPPTDTTFMLLHVLPQVNMTVFPNDSVCPGQTVTLTATGASAYTWKPASTLNQSTGAQVLATPTQQTTYIVNGNSFCNKDSAELTITLYSLDHQISPSDSVCPGVPHSLSASTGNNFSWTPAASFSNPNAGNTTVTLFSSNKVYVNFKSVNGCDIKDSVDLKVILPPNVKTASDTLICFSESLILNPHINGNYNFKWIPNYNLDDDEKKFAVASPKINTLYKAIVSNMCGLDTAYYNVRVSKVQGDISKDTTICRGDSIALLAKGGVGYLWSPSNTLTSSVIDNPKAFPSDDTKYKVVIINGDGCKDSLYTTVSLATKPFTGIKDEYLVEYGDDQKILANFEDYVWWSPATYLSCTDCASPTVHLPEDDITYQYLLYDKKGCYFKDSVKIYVIRKVYVPNAITLNGDGINDVFYFKSISVDQFELMIFNRWGELLFTSDDINKGWDGTYKGQDVQIDTYVWKVRYKRKHKDLWEEEYGTVTVVK